MMMYHKMYSLAFLLHTWTFWAVCWCREESPSSWNHHNIASDAKQNSAEHGQQLDFGDFRSFVFPDPGSVNNNPLSMNGFPDAGSAEAEDSFLQNAYFVSEITEEPDKTEEVEDFAIHSPSLMNTRFPEMVMPSITPPAHSPVGEQVPFPSESHSGVNGAKTLMKNNLKEHGKRKGTAGNTKALSSNMADLLDKTSKDDNGESHSHFAEEYIAKASFEIQDLHEEFLQHGNQNGVTWSNGTVLLTEEDKRARRSKRLARETLQTDNLEGTAANQGDENAEEVVSGDGENLLESISGDGENPPRNRDEDQNNGNMNYQTNVTDNQEQEISSTTSPNGDQDSLVFTTHFSGHHTDEDDHPSVSDSERDTSVESTSQKSAVSVDPTTLPLPSGPSDDSERYEVTEKTIETYFNTTRRRESKTDPLPDTGETVTFVEDSETQFETDEDALKNEETQTENEELTTVQKKENKLQPSNDTVAGSDAKSNDAKEPQSQENGNDDKVTPGDDKQDADNEKTENENTTNGSEQSEDYAKEQTMKEVTSSASPHIGDKRTEPNDTVITTDDFELLTSVDGTATDTSSSSSSSSSPSSLSSSSSSSSLTTSSTRQMRTSAMTETRDDSTEEVTTKMGDPLSTTNNALSSSVSEVPSTATSGATLTTSTLKPSTLQSTTSTTSSPSSKKASTPKRPVATTQPSSSTTTSVKLVTDSHVTVGQTSKSSNSTVQTPSDLTDTVTLVTTTEPVEVHVETTEEPITDVTETTVTTAEATTEPLTDTATTSKTTQIPSSSLTTPTTQETSSPSTATSTTSATPVKTTTTTPTDTTATITTPTSTSATTSTTQEKTTTTPTTPTTTTMSTTITTTTTTTATTTTTTPVPKIGDTCNKNLASSTDTCTYEHGHCNNGTCGCVWQMYVQEERCMEYKLENPKARNVTLVSPQSLRVMWTDVTFPEAKVIAYNVSWTEMTSSGEVGPYKEITDKTSYIIDALTPGTEYTIGIAAVIAPVWGQGKTLTLDFELLAKRTPPSLPGEVISTVQNSDDGRVVTLTFDPPEGHFDQCYATVYELDLQGERVDSLPPQQFDCTSLRVSPIKIGINYTMDVYVQSGNLKSPNKTFTFSTPATVPGRIQSLNIENVLSGAVDVTWPPTDSSNGYLDGYDVRLYTKERCVLLIDVTMSSDRNEENESDGEGGGDRRRSSPVQCDNTQKKTIEPRQADGRLVVTFGDLRPGTSHTASVAVRNLKYAGPEVKLNFTTLSNVPGAPTEIHGSVKDSSTIVIDWKPPPYPGPTTYLIQVFSDSKGEQGQCQSGSLVNNFTIPGYEVSQLTVSNLHYYTAYCFNIQASTSAGYSPIVHAGPFVTMEKVSGPVTNLSVTKVTSKSVSLQWDPPENVFGRLTAYVIFVQRHGFQGICDQIVTLYQGSDKPSKVNQTFCDSKQYELGYYQNGTTYYMVINLDPYVRYDIVVAPYNGMGVGTLSSVTILTNMSVPDAPSGLSCSYPSEGEILLSWEQPNLRTGPTTYHIIVNQARTYNTIEFGSDLVRNETVAGFGTTSFTVTGLRSYWLYTFTLSASTTAGESVSVSSSPCRTTSTEPGPVKNFDISLNKNNVTVADLTWRCPAEIDRHGLIESFVISQVPKTFQRHDLKPGFVTNSTYTVTAGKNRCEAPYNISIPVVTQVNYTFMIQAKVHSVQGLGEPVSSVFQAPANPPPAIPTVPAQVSQIETTPLKEHSFPIKMCIACLLDNSRGEIMDFGLIVCQEGYCDQITDLKNVGKNLITWKTARSRHFKNPYRATDKSWRTLIQSYILQGSDVGYEVGNDTSCSHKPETTFCNGPLPSGKSFRVRQFSCTEGGCTVSDPSAIFMTAESKSQPSSDGIVIGGAVAGVVVAVLVIIVVVVVKLRLRTPKRDSYSGRDSELSQVIALTDMAPERSEKIRPIKIRDFETKLQTLHEDENALFIQEYSELEKQTPLHTMDIGSDLDNRQDNRWTNILPYDHSRVTLTVVDEDDVCSSDYVNANYIPGLDSEREYIATQGPLTRTVPQFWRMVWEHNSSVIVMLSDFEEMDKRTQMMREKVARYFPDEEESKAYQYGHILVARTGKIDRREWEIRTFKITHTRERKTRVVKHFFFKRWSDHEADINPSDLIDFVEVVRAETSSHPQAPLVVHCSAGVGRTGTYLAVDYFYKFLKELRHKSGNSRRSSVWERTVDIFGRVLTMRDKRRFMVQTRNQYFFIYDAVQDLLKRLFQETASNAAGGDDDEDDEDDEEEGIYANVSSLQGSNSPDDAVYDDVEQLKGQVTVDRKL